MQFISQFTYLHLLISTDKQRYTMQFISQFTYLHLLISTDKQQHHTSELQRHGLSLATGKD